MNLITGTVDPVVMLSDPEVKSYLITILKDQHLSPEQKYKTLINLFEREKQIRLKILEYANQARDSENNLSIEQIAYQVGKDFDVWDPDLLLSQCETSIKQAIRRLMDSQHDDGGWGYQPNISSPWGTAHAINCLCVAKQIEDFEFSANLDVMIRRGIEYLARNRSGWSVENIPKDERIFVYELSMVIRCYYSICVLAPTIHTSKEFERAIKMGLDRLILIQNRDNGSWENAQGDQPRYHPEVGATSYAILALVRAGLPEYQSAVEKGISWLVQEQNDDGSWNYKYIDPQHKHNYTVHSISKTGDALQALMAASQGYKLEGGKWETSINRAYLWLKSQQKPVLDNGVVSGWGWLKDQSRFQQDPDFGLENTCITLETLVRNPGHFLPLLSSSAKWLIKLQYKDQDDPRVHDPRDIGKWDHENTARITSSLIQFYISLKGFSPADMEKL